MLVGRVRGHVQRARARPRRDPDPRAGAASRAPRRDARAHARLRLVQRAARRGLRGRRPARGAADALRVRARHGARSTRCASALALFCVLYGAAAILYARLPARSPTRAAGGLARALAREPADRRQDLARSSSSTPSAAASSARRSSPTSSPSSSRAAAAQVALLFAAGRVLSAFSHLGAAWLAQAHRPREHDGVHARPVVPAALHDRRGRQLRGGGRALPAARGAQRDGRAHAPVVRDGGGAAPRSASPPRASPASCAPAAGRSRRCSPGVMMQARRPGRCRWCSRASPRSPTTCCCGANSGA